MVHGLVNLCNLEFYLLELFVDVVCVTDWASELVVRRLINRGVCDEALKMGMPLALRANNMVFRVRVPECLRDIDK